jgi:phosphatidylinositol alpha-mannosyltransferase
MRPIAPNVPVDVVRPAHPLRIGIVTEYYYPLLGGISENVHHTATELAARGHSVTIVCSGQTNGFHQRVPNGIPTKRIGRSAMFYFNGAIARFSVGTSVWGEMRDLLRADPFDMLQLHSPLVATLPPIAALLARCPRVGTFHSYFDRSMVYEIFKGVLQKQFVRRLDGVTVVSPSVQRAMNRYFDFDARVVPNGVDTKLFHPGAPRLDKFSRDKRTLLFLGRFDPRNSFPFMLKAFTEVRKRLDDVRLVVVGTGPLEPVYRKMVPAHLVNDVHFEGAALIDRPSYYTTADVFCSPISNASFGITLLEAMASGTPVVATDNVGYRELLKSDEALLVPFEVDAYARGIIQALGDDPLRASLRDAGLRKAQEYSWPAVVNQLLAYFEEIRARA